MENERWLRCTVSPGQFPGEFAVSLQSADGHGYSLFAPEEDVDPSQIPSEGIQVDGWIRVSIVDENGVLALVRLPRQAIENGAFVTVRKDQLERRRQAQEA